jgi:hypothetical protein
LGGCAFAPFYQICQMTNKDFARLIRRPAYFVLIFVTLMPLVEVLANLWPYKLTTPMWRFGAVGAVTGVLTPMMIGFVLLVAVALLAEDRVFLWLFAIVGAVVAIIVAGSLIVFLLDALQTRSQVRDDGVHRFDFATVLAAARVAFVSAGSAMLAFAAYAGLNRKTRTAGQGAPATGGLLGMRNTSGASQGSP